MPLYIAVGFEEDLLDLKWEDWFLSSFPCGCDSMDCLIRFFRS